MSVQLPFPHASNGGDSNRAILEKLASLRQEWETAAGEDNLLDVSASVGLMLVDVSTKLDLTPEERAFFLGSNLDGEASSLLANS